MIGVELAWLRVTVNCAEPAPSTTSVSAIVARGRSFESMMVPTARESVMAAWVALNNRTKNSSSYSEIRSMTVSSSAVTSVTPAGINTDLGVASKSRTGVAWWSGSAVDSAVATYSARTTRPLGLSSRTPNCTGSPSMAVAL